MKELFSFENSGIFKIFNPSICFHNNRYLISARFSNATMKNLALYLLQKLNYKSKIVFLYLDTNFKLINKFFIDFKNNYPLEDPRIIKFKNKIYVSVTEVVDSKNIKPVLYQLQNNLEIFRRIDYIGYDSSKNINKNWCPFVHKNKLMIHTDSYPVWKVYEINLSSGLLKKIIEKENTLTLPRSKNTYIRCSTSWKNFTKKSFLCGLHIKYYDPIFHKFAKIRTILVEICKKTLLPIKETEPFSVDENELIQFLSGLEIKDNKIILTYGIGDYKTVIYSISQNKIKKMLKSII